MQEWGGGGKEKEHFREIITDFLRPPTTKKKKIKKIWMRCDFQILEIDVQHRFIHGHKIKKIWTDFSKFQERKQNVAW